MSHEEPLAQGPNVNPGMTTAESALLSIGDLAQHTGVSPAVLRMWETRHGFPEPQRLASGHRRYREQDVDLVKQVLRRKDAGIKLEVAIADAIAGEAPVGDSVFAEVRRRHPSLAVQRLSKASLIALSWAIEDECCAKADRPILFGGFQKERFFAPSAARWSELARVSRAAVVLADDWSSPEASDRFQRATLAADAPMRREWVVVCDAFDATAFLSAWELPGQADVPDRERIFEAVWSIDPTPVRDAARVAAKVAADAGLDEARPLLFELADSPSPRATSPAGATALFNRVLAYADRLR